MRKLFIGAIIFTILLIVSVSALISTLLPNGANPSGSGYTLEGGYTLTTYTALSSACIGQINASDGVWCLEEEGTNARDAYFKTNFTMPSGTINSVVITGEGKSTSTSAGTCTLGLYNYTSSAWVSVTSSSCTSSADVVLTYNISNSARTNFINSGGVVQAIFVIFSTAVTDDLNLDYMGAQVDYTPVPPTITLQQPPNGTTVTNPTLTFNYTYTVTNLKKVSFHFWSSSALIYNYSIDPKSLWLNLSQTNTSYINLSSQYTSLAINASGSVYIGDWGGNLSVYNPDSNSLVPLSSTTLATVQGILAMGLNSSGEVFVGSGTAKFGVYTPKSNTYTDLSATDTGNWWGPVAVMSIKDNGSSDLYTGGSGEFGVYNSKSNVWTDLGATDAGNWMGTGGVFDLAINASGDVYTIGGADNRSFGVYSPKSNVWTNLSQTDTGNWANGPFYAMAINASGDVYTGGVNGLFGVYSPKSNVWTDLSATDANNWFGTSNINSLYINSNGLVYTGGDAASAFGVYDPSTNVWTNLNETDTDNWVESPFGVEDLAINSSGSVYTVGLNASFGVYTPQSLNFTYTIPSQGTYFWNYQITDAYSQSNWSNANWTIIYSTGEDTCTYTGPGDWAIDCADACAFSTTTTISSGDVYATGTGTLAFNSGGKWAFTGTNQRLYIDRGCTFHINSGGGFF